MLSSEDVASVKASWKSLSDLDAVAALFYQNLFMIDPSLREYFPEDMEDQKKKLMTMLNLAVTNLDNLGPLTPAVIELGRRHIDYKIEKKHYQPVGQALLETLEAGLGERFTPALKASWTEVYLTLASTMQQAYE